MEFTEKKVMNIVQTEIEDFRQSLSKLSNDLDSLKEGVKRIERVLSGDKDFDDKGMAYKVNFSYDYARKNIENAFVKRSEKVLKKFEVYEEQGLWKIFEEIVDNYKALKMFTVVIGSSGLVSAVNIIYMIIKLLVK